MDWFRMKINVMKNENETSIGSHDHITISGGSHCPKETKDKIKDKVFKLQGRFIEDLRELQNEVQETSIGGTISYDLDKIQNHEGGIKINLILG